MEVAVLLAIVLAYLHQAHASRRIIQPRNDVPVSTPYGEVPKYMARYVCAGQHVFIGNIVTVSSRLQGRRVLSDLTFEVERTVYGVPLPEVTLTVLGGEIEGRVVGGLSELPLPRPGLRYLISYSLLKQSVGVSQINDPIITATFRISPPSEVPTSELPTEDELRDTLDAFCQEQDLPRYHDVMGG